MHTHDRVSAHRSELGKIGFLYRGVGQNLNTLLKQHTTGIGHPETLTVDKSIVHSARPDYSMGGNISSTTNDRVFSDNREILDYHIILDQHIAMDDGKRADLRL
ncbi:hypothetical protein PSJM300_13365 [Stutzerimonas stutzeri DSM 10701]|nr:hypothetical protein PSJM300_13365 [Stutzerimonas stutzeri DSM 10701]